MKRKWLAVGIILLFVGATIAPTIAQNTEKSESTSRGNWLYVGGSGPGNYTTIQDAINDASDGDIICVFQGTYNESLIIDKSITVFGMDKNTTIIDGQIKKNSIVTLEANYINFSGFKITGCSPNGTSYAMIISADFCRVTSNIFTGNQGNHGSIVIVGDYNQINNNTIRNQSDYYGHYPGGYGICISDTASDNVISDNYIIANPTGIWDISHYNNIVTKNHICNNSRKGIWITSTSGNVYSHNTIENNGETGIYLEDDATNNIITGNIIKNNGEGLVIYDAVSEVITNNSFYNQGIQFTSNALQYWTSHTISNNSINDKPIYYFKSEENLMIPSDAGQIILVDCKQCLIQNMFIENVDYGILLGYSSNNTIVDNQFFNITETAITLKESQKNELGHNNIINCDNGVLLSILSNFTILHDNVIKDNTGFGIYLQSVSNIIDSNNIEQNGIGINIDLSNFNTISRNNIEHNGIGINIDLSDFNAISKNNFINNSESQINYLINYIHPKSNKIKHNYYGSDGLFIKIIYGTVRTRFSWGPADFYRTGFIIDWFPAQQPYNIPQMT